MAQTVYTVALQVTFNEYFILARSCYVFEVLRYRFGYAASSYESRNELAIR